MTRRELFGAVTSTLVALGLRKPTDAVADPLLPYCKASNAARFSFLRESEIAWLNEATALANRVAQEQRAVDVEKVVPPYDRKVSWDTYELPDGTRARIAPTVYVTTEDDDA